MSGDNDSIDLTFLAKLSERILGEMAGFRGEMAEVRGEMAGFRGEMAGFRGEMAEVRGEMADMRGEMSGMRADITEMRTDIADLKAEQRQQGQTLLKVIDAVTALAERQETQSVVIGKIHEGQMIIERDLSAIKMRVERIERHTGLVQA